MTILALNALTVLAIMSVMMLQWVHNQQPVILKRQKARYCGWNRGFWIWRTRMSHNDCVIELLRKSALYMEPSEVIA